MVLRPPKTTLFWFCFLLCFIFLKNVLWPFQNKAATALSTPVVLHQFSFKLHLSLNIQSCLWPNAWYCGTELITENLVHYKFTESFLLNIPKRIWDIRIINYEISTCISKCSRAEWYVHKSRAFLILLPSRNRDSSNSWSVSTYHSALLHFGMQVEIS